MVTVSSIVFSTVALGEVKDFVRVDTDAHDVLLQTLIDSAMVECFNITHNMFGTATVTLKRWEQVYSIDLPYAPIVSITSVLLDGEAAVVDTDYELKGTYLDIKTAYTDTIEVEYEIGMDLPADVKHAIFQRVKYGYDYGDDLAQPETPRFFDRVIGRYRHHQTYVG